MITFNVLQQKGKGKSPSDRLTRSKRLRSVVVTSRTRNRDIEGSIHPGAVALH